jgi:hypothetical protein
MKIHQISLFIENKPGHVAAPARVLAEAGVDIRALYLADTQQYGILRFIVSDWERAAKALEARGYVVKVTDVLAILVTDRPGGLADVLGTLDGTGINIEYMYAFSDVRGDQAILIFCFADTDTAITSLQAAGVKLMTNKELLKN